MSFSVSFDPSWVIFSPSSFGPFNAPVSEKNDFLDVTVFPEWYTQTSLQWKIPESWGNCKFHVYYWPGGEEGYIRLTSTPITNLFYKNVDARDYSKFENSSAYVVEAILPSGQTVRSSPTTNGYKRRGKIEKIANEIQRREYLLLTKFAGIKSYLFKRRQFGERCPRCWNKDLEKVMDDRCPVCFGTSWNGGYFDPVPLFVQYESTPNIRTRDIQGRMEPNAIGAWTISVPEINPEDVIVRTGDYDVYIVTSMTPTELQTQTVKQNLALTQLSRIDIENELMKRIQSNTSFNYIKEFPGRFIPKRFPTTLLDKTQENDPAWAQEQNLQNLPKYEI